MDRAFVSERNIRETMALVINMVNNVEQAVEMLYLLMLYPTQDMMDMTRDKAKEIYHVSHINRECPFNEA